VRLLEHLRGVKGVETHLVVSRAARQTLALETNLTVGELEKLADCTHSPNDVGAAVSSGSFRTHGMVVAPCSVKTISNIAYGNTADLIARAADVALKERRRVILMLRETPLHVGHIETMLRVSQIGAVVFPPVPAFYNRPRSVLDIVDQSVMRCLDLLDIECAAAPRWGETRRKLTRAAEQVVFEAAAAEED
jgi:4-hydroxy-3-polyprenylbenzoate decarboxylase